MSRFLFKKLRCCRSSHSLLQLIRLLLCIRIWSASAVMYKHVVNWNGLPVDSDFSSVAFFYSVHK